MQVDGAERRWIVPQQVMLLIQQNFQTIIETFDSAGIFVDLQKAIKAKDKPLLPIVAVAAGIARFQSCLRGLDQPSSFLWKILHICSKWFFLIVIDIDYSTTARQGEWPNLRLLSEKAGPKLCEMLTEWLMNSTSEELAYFQKLGTGKFFPLQSTEVHKYSKVFRGLPKAYFGVGCQHRSEYPQ